MTEVTDYEKMDSIDFAIEMTKSLLEFLAGRAQEVQWDLLKKMVFPSREDAQFFIRFIFASCQQKTYVAGESGGGNTLLLNCVEKGCKSFIKFNRRNGCFSHSEHQLHSSCFGQFKPKAEYLRKFFYSNILTNFKNKIKGIMDFCEKYGWSITKNVAEDVAYRDQSKFIRQTVLEDIALLEPFLLAFKKQNPDWDYRLDREADGLFTRLILYFPWAHELKLTRRIIAIDSCHVKDIMLTSIHCKEREKLESMKIIAVTTKRSTNNNILLAFSLCLNEQSVEFVQILEYCKSKGLDINNSKQVIISDRAESIKKAIKSSATHAYHVCCPLHLKRNLEAKFKKSNIVVSKVN